MNGGHALHTTHGQDLNSLHPQLRLPLSLLLLSLLLMMMILLMLL